MLFFLLFLSLFQGELLERSVSFFCMCVSVVDFDSVNSRFYWFQICLVFAFSLLLGKVTATPKQGCSAVFKQFAIFIQRSDFFFYS